MTLTKWKVADEDTAVSVGLLVRSIGQIHPEVTAHKLLTVSEECEQLCF